MSVVTNDIRTGNKLDIDKEPWLVVDIEFVKPGKGQAFNRIKIKNMISGRVVERTYKAGDKLDYADIETNMMTFSYLEDSGAIFIDEKTFDQVLVSNEVIKNIQNFIMEDVVYQVTFYKGNPIEVVPPFFLDMKITETSGGARGDTASGRVMKAAKTHTGHECQIPIFIEEGEMVKIDTRTGEYASRSSEK